MVPRILLVLFGCLVGMMIIQVCVISFRTAVKNEQKPLMRAKPVNTAKAAVNIESSESLSTAEEGAKVTIATKDVDQEGLKLPSTPEKSKEIAKMADETGSPSDTNNLAASQHSLASRNRLKPIPKHLFGNPQQRRTKKRFRPDDKMLFISEFDKAKETKPVEVLVIIMTYYKYFHRRDIIRSTWLEACKKNEKVACWFFTDSLDAIQDPKDKEKILQEQKQHNDIIFTPIGNGIKFGIRFLYAIMWGKANYDFKYIIRSDDDIMICIDHLLWDLPNLPSTDLHYGWMHCQMPNIVYIDEGFSMFSNDLVEKYLSQKGDKIMCHPFGDQQIAVWEHTLGIKGPDVYKPDNSRIHHNPPASYDNGLKAAVDICDNFIAIHGVYKDDALAFWKKRGTGKFNKYPGNKPSDFCPHYPNVDIKLFGGMYHHDPQLCTSDPRWNVAHHVKYVGREG